MNKVTKKTVTNVCIPHTSLSLALALALTLSVYLSLSFVTSAWSDSVPTAAKLIWLYMCKS